LPGFPHYLHTYRPQFTDLHHPPPRTHHTPAFTPHQLAHTPPPHPTQPLQFPTLHRFDLCTHIAYTLITHYNSPHLVLHSPHVTFTPHSYTLPYYTRLPQLPHTHSPNHLPTHALLPATLNTTISHRCYTTLLPLPRTHTHTHTTTTHIHALHAQPTATYTDHATHTFHGACLRATHRTHVYATHCCTHYTHTPRAHYYLPPV